MSLLLMRVCLRFFTGRARSFRRERPRINRLNLSGSVITEIGNANVSACIKLGACDYEGKIHDIPTLPASVQKRGDFLRGGVKFASRCELWGINADF